MEALKLGLVARCEFALAGLGSAGRRSARDVLTWVTTLH